MPAPLRFRAWHTEQKRMYSPEEMGADELTLAVNGRGLVNVSGTSSRLSQYAGSRMVVMQSTGHTKDGVEIFEGDVLENHKRERAAVVWYQKNARWSVAHGTHPKALYRWTRNTGTKVVGNVHQHPHLLAAPAAA